ncbi:MAG: tetratricopeptide repeat protein [Desulfobulbaceae bacterium]|nr:tetratricopeptide repeat protein [Desulfobulbaceae bacterium]
MKTLSFYPGTIFLTEEKKTSTFIKAAISMLSLFITCMLPHTIYAEHGHVQAPESHGHAEHYEGDGHDHGHGTANKASQLNDEGIALYRAKDYKAAAEKFKQAVAEAPNIGEVHAMLGKTQVKLGEFEAAVATLKTSLELTKNETINRLSHKSMARAYIGLGKFEEARSEIERYKEMCIAQNALTPKTEKIISDLYEQLK